MDEVHLLRSLDPARPAVLEEIWESQDLEGRLARLVSGSCGTLVGPKALAAPAVRRHRRRSAVASLLAAAAVVAVLSVAVPLNGRRSFPKGAFTTAWAPGVPASSAAPLQLSGPGPGQFRLASYIESAGWKVTAQGLPPGYLDCPTVSACYVMTETSLSRSGRPVPEAVYFSRDGGESWSSLRLPAGFFSGTPLSCSSAVACAAGGAMTDGEGVFVSTSDGGHRWTVVPLPSKGQLVELACSSASSCDGVMWSPARRTASARSSATTETESFVSTTDEGATWSVRRFPRDWRDTSLSCPTGTVCVAAGYRPQAPGTSFSVVVLFTTDRGMRWQAGRFQQPESHTVMPLVCASTSDCTAIALGPVQFISTPAPAQSIGAADVLSTADGAKTWRIWSLPESRWGASPNFGIGVDPVDLSCAAGGKCWLAGPFGLISTADGGRSWSAQRLAGGYGVLQVSCPEANACVALGYAPSGHPRSVPVYSSIGGS
jgi:hypothetical protein